MERRPASYACQRCDACANVYFPPRPFCPSCASRKVSVFKASGKGTLYSYVINHRPAAPGFTPALRDRRRRTRRRPAHDEQYHRTVRRRRKRWSST